eukprot:2607191-Pyramimonas_sp.AAC.1
MAARALSLEKTGFFGVRSVLDQRASRLARKPLGKMCVASSSPCGPLVSLCPYFKVPEENLEAFKKNVIEGFYPKMANEPKCKLYNFTFDGTTAHCREVYEDAEGLLFHLENVDKPLKVALGLAEMARLECHGPAEELAKLKEPLKDLPVTYFTQL